MTDLAERIAIGRAGGPQESRRSDAFREAMRHSIRVRFLRRTTLFGSIGIVIALLAFSLFDPFRVLPRNVSVGAVGIRGTKVTMEQPKLAGFHKDGRPYELRAAAAVQDIHNPNVLELVKLDASIQLADRTTAHVLSETGTYDTTADHMDLTRDVRVKSDSGYDITMQSASINFKTGSVVTHEPLTVVMQTGTVTADSMVLSDNGKQITFEGHVKTVILSAATATETAKNLKGSDR